MMAQRILLLLLTAFSATVTYAQRAKLPQTGPGILYDREVALNLRVGTNRAMMVGMEFGRLRSYYRTTYYYASLGELRHAKEQRQSADPVRSGTFRPYVFGKQNNFFALRGGWGVKRYYSEKARTKGVAVGVSYAAGPTLGILKPYYLALRRIDVNNPNSSNFRLSAEKYSEERNGALFLDNTKINGAASFWRGMDELSVRPGVNASAAVHLDWGAFDEMVKAVEIGVMLDVFPSRVPIMVAQGDTDRINHPFFLSFFANLQLGKRQ
jgi:hypothetical protein